MKVNSIRMKNFRNYQDETVEFSPGINVIAGENAQGKTNLLEAVYLLSCGRGFRNRTDRELISFCRDHAHIIGGISSGGRDQSIDVRIRSGSKKQIYLNEVKTSGSELTNSFRVVLFGPDDLNMIKSGAAERRRFLDMAISQLRPAYGSLISQYGKLLENKRHILTDWHEKPSLLDTLDDYSESMCRCAAQIIRYRAAYTKRLADTAIPIHSEFSGIGETLELEYMTVKTVTDPFAPAEQLYEQLMEHQKEHREAEIASGNVLTGPHKDDIEISINGVSARTYASQGQTRTAAISFKMAEREISFQETGENPVLLLDDVVSELDEKRQEFVLNRIGGGQTLITCCEDDRIEHRTGGRVIAVHGGLINGGSPGKEE